MVTHIKSTLQSLRESDTKYDTLYSKFTKMVEIADLPALEVPRLCARQTQRSNLPASSPKEYYRLSLYIYTLSGHNSAAIGHALWAPRSKYCEISPLNT